MQVRFQHRRMCSDAFAEFLSPAHDLIPIAMPGCKHTNETQEWHTSRCVFVVSETSPYAMRRDKHHALNTGNLLLFSRPIYGQARGAYGNEANDRKPGELIISDQGSLYECVVEAQRLQSIYVTKSQLGFDPDKPLKTVSISRHSMLGQMVHDSMDEIFHLLQNAGTGLSDVKLDSLFSCLKIAMGVPVQRGDVRAHARAALHTLICRYIEHNLGDPFLTTSTLLRQFGVSRASLYRMFEAEGGVRNYITERRATRAILEISKAPNVRGQIQRAAMEAGFLTAPSFNRTIKRLYGISPGGLFQPEPAQKESHSISPIVSEHFDLHATIAA